MTTDSLEVFLSQFGTSPLFHVWFSLLLLDLHADFSGGRSVGLVVSSLKNFPVCCDPHSQRLKTIQHFLVYLFFNWRIIALQNFIVFCQTPTWISHRYGIIPQILLIRELSQGRVISILWCFPLNTKSTLLPESQLNYGHHSSHQA